MFYFISQLIRVFYCFIDTIRDNVIVIMKVQEAILMMTSHVLMANRVISVHYVGE